MRHQLLWKRTVDKASPRMTYTYQSLQFPDGMQATSDDSTRSRCFVEPLVATLVFLMSACITLPALAQPPADPSADSAAEEGSPPVPEGARLSRKTPDVMKIEKLLITNEMREEVKQQRTEYKRVLRNGDLTDSAKKVIAAGIQVKVLEMSDPEKLKILPELRRDVVRDVYQAGQLQSQAKARTRFREFLLGEVVKNATLLFDNHLTVRINAAALLGQLNLEEARRNVPEKPFLPAARPLADVLADDSQPEAVKIIAARAITRFLKTDNLDPTVRLSATQALINDLARKDTDPWLQMRLVHTIAWSQLLVDRSVNRRLFVIDALSKVLVDTSRTPLVRAEAAWALGRVPVNSSVNGERIAHEIIRFAKQMIDEQQKSPTEFYWRSVFAKIYLAFYPEGAEAVARKDGLLEKLKAGDLPTAAATTAAIESSSKLTSKLARHVLSSKTAIPDALEAPVDEWLKNSKPASLSFATGLEPIVEAAPMQPMG